MKYETPILEVLNIEENILTLSLVPGDGNDENSGGSGDWGDL